MSLSTECSTAFLSLRYPSYISFYIVLVIIYSVKFPLFFQFSVTGAGAGFFWWVGLMAGLQVGQALGCSGCLLLGSAVPVPHDCGHPTSICNSIIGVIVENDEMQDVRVHLST